MNLTRLPLNFDTGARQFIKRLTIALERGIHGRNLLRFPFEAGENRFNGVDAGQTICGFNDGPRKIPRIGTGTKADRGYVAFVGVEEIGRKLGGLTEAER